MMDSFVLVRVWADDAHMSGNEIVERLLIDDPVPHGVAVQVVPIELPSSLSSRAIGETIQKRIDADNYAGSVEARSTPFDPTLP